MTKYRILIFFFFSLTILNADEKRFPYTVSVSPEIGLMFGTAHSSVYDVDDSLLSKLTYDVTPLFYYGASLHFFHKETLPRFSLFADLSLKSGLNFVPNGRLKDYDWENSELSNYSEHDSRSENAFFLDFMVGTSFKIAGILLLKPYLGVSYIDISWIATDGYYHYPPDDNTQKIPMTGPVITYMQNWIMIYPGIAVSFPFRNFTFNAAFQASPILFSYGDDNHLLLINNQHNQLSNYKDTAQFGLYLEPSAQVRYAFTERFLLSLTASYRYMETAQGESTARLTGDSQIVTSTSYTLATPITQGIRYFHIGLLAHIVF
jgi:outer membrane protease